MTLGQASAEKINKESDFGKLKSTEKAAKLLAHKGTISKGTNTASKLVVSGAAATAALKIVNGSWTNDVAIEVGTAAASGNIAVGAGLASNATAVLLDFAPKTTLTINSGTIVVGASSNTPISATLDLSELTKDDFVIGTQNSELKAQGNAYRQTILMF